MADRKNFFFEQRVTQAELDDAYADLEVADRNIAKDAFSGVNFLMATGTVTEDGPQSTSILVGDFLGWDILGQRVEKVTGPTAFSFAGDDGANIITASLYIKFARLDSDPRTDGNGATVQFESEESFVIERDLGPDDGTQNPPAPRGNESIHIADVSIPIAAGVIINSGIDVTMQNLQSAFPINRVKGMTPGMEDAMEATAVLAPTTANRVALLSDAGVGVMRGYISNVKIVALSGTTADVERATAVNGGATPVLLMDVKNAGLNVAITGPGGLDVGVVANAVYYVYLIGDTLGVGADDVCMSLDPGPGHAGAGPNLAVNFPNHDVFRLIGVVVRDAGAILPFRQINNEYLYDDLTLTYVFGPTGADPFGAGAGPTAYQNLVLAPYVTPVAERAKLHFHLLTGALTGPLYGFRSLGGPAVAGFTQLVGGGAGGSQTQVTSVNFDVHVDVAESVDWNRQLGPDPATFFNHQIDIAVLGMVLDLHHD